MPCEASSLNASCVCLSLSGGYYYFAVPRLASGDYHSSSFLLSLWFRLLSVRKRQRPRVKFLFFMQALLEISWKWMSGHRSLAPPDTNTWARPRVPCSRRTLLRKSCERPTSLSAPIRSLIKCSGKGRPVFRPVVCPVF